MVKGHYLSSWGREYLRRRTFSGVGGLSHWTPRVDRKGGGVRVDPEEW